MNTASSRFHSRRILAILGALLIAASAAPASLPDGTPAPPINLTSLDGATVSTSSLAPRTLVLIFGDLDHERTQHASADALDVIQTLHAEVSSVVPIIIVASKPTSGAGNEKPRATLVLSDPNRDAFGAYKVLVLPTVVVIDGKGTVVHSMPGFLPRFKEILTQSVLVATGKAPAEQLERSLTVAPEPPDEDANRVGRLVHLGTELSRHGMFDMAGERYNEALALDPTCEEARLGLGNLMLSQSRPADAETIFGSILASHPDSVEAALGLAEARISRGGDHLVQAHATIQTILENQPNLARAHFLFARILEARGELRAAADEYRRTVQLLKTW